MKKSSGNDPSFQSVGNLTSIKQTPDGIEIIAANAQIRVTVYTPEIFRIEAAKPRHSFEDFSYAVIAEPRENIFSFKENENAVRVSTSACVLEIDKNPVRVFLRNHSGDSICEDDAAFGMGWLGSEPYCFKKLQDNEKFFGLGEKTGRLNRRGHAFNNWNTDFFGYSVNADPLYASIPFYIGYHHNMPYGIFFNNTYRSWFDFGASNERFSFFNATDGPLSYYLISGDTVSDIIRNYTHLTGRMPLPPRWSLGLQQCRYSYYPDKEVYTVAKTFRDKKIPCDVIYLDIHYMQDYKVFTWNEKRFPDPDKLIKTLREWGFHAIPIFDPGIKKQEGYDPYETGIKNDCFVKYPDGSLYEGEVWPGICHFPDFTNQKTRSWWGKNFKPLVEDGIEGFWNDMNEPAVWGQHIPELIEFDFDGNRATLRKARNVYGMQMARSTYEGAKNLLKNKRPFCLTRAGYSGIQRYSAIWTGDNVSSDEHLLLGIRLINSLGLSGVSFCGCDIGGFSGECTPDLFARWIAVGAFSPFFRCHSIVNSRDAEPWSFGEEVEDISRNFITLRYRLMPYLYSTFFESSQTGMPVSRSLILNFIDDPKIYYDNYQHQFLFGPSLMVIPVTSIVSVTKIYLPEGKWFDLYNDDGYDGGREIFYESPKDKLPLFAKANGILLMQQAGDFAEDVKSDVLEIHCYPVADAQDFSWTYYDDDGISFQYESGMFAKRTLYLSGKEKKFVMSNKEGDFISAFQFIHIYMHGMNEDEFHPVINETEMEVMKTDYRFVQPVSSFDPQGKFMDESKMIRDLKYVRLPFSEETIQLNW